MSQVESPLGALDIESAARHEWLSWTKMADVEREAPPVLVGGDGPYVIESDGTRLLDAMSGLFTTQIGYSHGKPRSAPPRRPRWSSSPTTRTGRPPTRPRSR